MSKTCLNCEEEFQPTRHWQKFCVKNCAGAYWKKNNPDKVSQNNLKRLYGITLADKNEMLASQGGCGICGRKEPPNGRGWMVDHSHADGRIRGVLCAFCNSGVGYFGDNPETLRLAAQYLEVLN